MARLIYKPQHIDSNGGPNPSRTYHFQVVDTIVESTVRTIAANEYGPVIITPYGVLFRGDVRTNQTAYNQWDADVEYIPRPQDPGSWTWELDGTGVTEHVTHSLSTTASYPAGTAPNHKQAINWNDGEIEGADVIVPNARLSVTFTHPPGFMSLQYAAFLSSLAGYMNSDKFLLWQAGEVRFLGPRCSDGSQTQSQATYQFDISPNRSNLTIGDVTGVAKVGWDLLWIRYKLDTNTVSGTVYSTKVPQFVYVERVCNTVDFRSAFGFG